MELRFKEISDWFEHLSPESLKDIGSIYSEQALFRDPFNEIKGCAGVRQIYQHMFDTTKDPRFTITRIVIQGADAFMIWDFNFGLRGQSMKIHGCTHFSLNEAGLIILHRDYWDAAEELYEKIPLLGGFLRLLKRRLAIQN